MSSVPINENVTQMPGPTPTKDHPWGTAGHNVPPDNTLSPALIDLIYGPHDITTTYEWIYQNLPNHSILELGEGRLILGIFINAIACLKRGQYVEETWAWIMDKEADGFHSFNSICWYLKWHPDWIRKLTVERFSNQTLHPRQTYRAAYTKNTSYVAKRR